MILAVVKIVPDQNGIDPRKLARAARLRYVTDGEPGLSRAKRGESFVYLSLRGQPIKSEREVARLEQLAIPPAWQDVWICRWRDGHLQVTGRDDRKRKQYIYHDHWSAAANLAKFSRLRSFGKLLPKLREQIEHDLRQRKLTKRRVLAGILALLDLTGIRIGNEEYVKQNDSYGLTTLRNRHAVFEGNSVELRFKGKSGLAKRMRIDSPPLVRLLRECRELPGSKLFQYEDDAGEVRPLTSIEVNDYLRELTGQPVTAKDFRTWKASSLVAEHLFRAPLANERLRRGEARKAIAEAAELLGNTKTVCRNYYVHPGLLATYERGELAELLHGLRPREGQALSPGEQVLSCFLRRWQP